MWGSRRRSDPLAGAARPVLAGALLALVLVPAAAAAEAGAAPTALRVVELRGEVVLDGAVEYGPDVLLRVLPDTVVRAAPDWTGPRAPGVEVLGALDVRGLPGAPVRFHVPLAVRAPGGSVEIEHAVFEAAGGEGCLLSMAGVDAHLRHVVIEGGEAGLCVEGAESNAPSAPDGTAREPSKDAPQSESIVVEDLRVTGAGVGVHLAEGAPTVRISNATLAGNEVGLRADGGRAVLDHVTFADNRVWDVQAASTHNVAWTGTHVEPACSSIAGRESPGCERGSLPLAPLVLLLSVLFLLTEAGRYALTRFAFWLGLYSRIAKEDLPDHPARAQLLEIVTRMPGVHFQAIVRLVGGSGRTMYHLQRLEQAGFVSSRRDGPYRRFYPQGHPQGAGAPTTRDRVLAAIAGRPGIHALGVAELLGLSRQRIAYHVAQLVAAGLVVAEPQARRMSLRATGDSNVEGLPSSSPLRPATGE